MNRLPLMLVVLGLVASIWFISPGFDKLDSAQVLEQKGSNEAPKERSSGDSTPNESLVSEGSLVASASDAVQSGQKRQATLGSPATEIDLNDPSAQSLLSLVYAGRDSQVELRLTLGDELRLVQLEERNPFASISDIYLDDQKIALASEQASRYFVEQNVGEKGSASITLKSDGSLSGFVNGEVGPYAIALDASGLTVNPRERLPARTHQPVQF